LQRIQISSIVPFSKDILVQSLVTLVRDLRLSSASMDLEQIQWVSCNHLPKLPVHKFNGPQQHQRNWYV